MAARWGAAIAFLIACNSPSTTADRGSAAAHEPSARVRVGLRDFGSAPLVAFQDGDQAWHRVACEDGLWLPVSGSRYGVASACGIGTPSVTITHATVEELPELTVPRCGDEAGISFHGRLVGVQGAPRMAVSTVEEPVDGDGAFRIEVEPGTYDVIAADRVVGADGERARRIAIVRDVDLTADRTLELDLSRDGVDTVPRTVRVIGALPGDKVGIRSAIQTSRRTEMVLAKAAGGNGEVVVRWVPDRGRAPTDRLSVMAVARNGDTARYAVTSGGDVVFGPPIGNAAVDAEIDGTRLRVRATWSRHEGAHWYDLELVQPLPEPRGVVWQVNVSSAWLRDADTMTYAVPDLFSIEWPDAVALRPGTPLVWKVLAWDHAPRLGQRWESTFVARGASRRGAFIP
jgi:hypothetical protein